MTKPIISQYLRFSPRLLDFRGSCGMLRENYKGVPFRLMGGNMGIVAGLMAVAILLLAVSVIATGVFS